MLFRSIKVPADMLKLATHILETKKGKFDPAKFEDRYETALKELVKAKHAGKKTPVASDSRPSNVINLMDALRRSAKADRDNADRREPAPTRRKTRARKPAAPRRKVRKAS